MADTPKCEECGEPMQLVMDPEDYPQKVYAVLSQDVDHILDRACDAANDLEFYSSVEDAILSSGFSDLLMGEYILNKTFKVKATVEIVKDEAAIKS